MLTLTYGYKQPETNDKGPVVFPALEFNIARLDAHTHDGSDSAKLSASSITPLTDTILNASWVLVANGIYSQTVTLPGALDYDLIHFDFRLNSDKSRINPTIERVSDTQYEIFINDNTIDIDVLYK